MKNIILIDASSLIYKAYFAIPNTLTNASGEAINAVYGFMSMIIRLIQKEKPDMLAIAFDKKGPTFRHKAYVEYKTNRAKTPEELHAQIPLIKEILHEINVPCFEMAGYEADDVLGSMAKQISKERSDYYVKIVSGDKDILQLVDDRILVLLSKVGISNLRPYTNLEVRNEFSLTPKQIIDFKALAGDKSDNIPGLSGVGKITAVKLLTEFNNVNNIFDNLDKLPEKLKNKFIAEEEVVRISYTLAEIVTDMELDYNTEDFYVSKFDFNKLKNIGDRLNFESLIKRIDLLIKHYQSEKDTNLNQMDLF